MAAGIVILASPVGAAILQVFDPADLTGGPHEMEDFEDDDFESGAAYSSASGVRRITSSDVSGGVTPSGTWGLTTNTPREPITVVFDLPATSVGMWFGNDDPCCSGGFAAHLDVFDVNGALLGTVSLTANMNDFADQFLGFNSDELVGKVAIRYGSGSDVDLFAYIDDVYFNSACGDGVIDPTEACDDGPANGTTTSCCSATCDAVAADERCDDEDACTETDTCDGAGTCVGESILLNPLADPAQTVQCVEQTLSETLP